MSTRNKRISWQDRFLSCALAVALVVSFVPSAAFADEEGEAFTDADAVTEDIETGGLEAEDPEVVAGDALEPLSENETDAAAENAFSAGSEDTAEAVASVTSVDEALEIICQDDAISDESKAAIAGIAEEETLSDEETIAMMAQSVPATPLATDATLSCGNGWVLSYSVSEVETDDGSVTEATITSVSSEGSGKLAIPATAGGYPVTAIANSVFASCTSLGTVVLPESLTSIGLYAFQNSSVQSINIPAGVGYLKYRTFTLCEKLTDITFDGDSLRYLSQNTFSYCSSLKTIEIPLLTAYPTDEEAEADGIWGQGIVTYDATIGAKCFYNCTSLETIIFDGPMQKNGLTYFADGTDVQSAAIVECPALTTLVCKGNAHTINVGNREAVYDFYYTMEFYASEEDAYNAETRLASLTYKSGSAKVFDLAYDTAGTYSKYLSEYSDDTKVPACPEGCVWVALDNNELTTDSSFSSSYAMVAVSLDDIGYASVTSPSIEAFRSGGGSTSPEQGMYGDPESESVIFTKSADGTIEDIEKISVVDTQGATISEDKYTLVFAKAGTSTVTDPDGKALSYTSYTEIAKEDVSDLGDYCVYAYSNGDFWTDETNYNGIPLFRDTNGKELVFIAKDRDGSYQVVSSIEVSSGNRGNTLSEATATGSDGYTYTWDREKSLKTVTYEGTDASGRQVSGEVTQQKVKSRTGYVFFTVSRTSPSVTTYGDTDSLSKYLADATYETAEQLSSTPAFSTIVPASDWRNQLLGASFAGTADGIVLTDCDPYYNSYMMSAFIRTKSNNYIVIGSSSVVPESAAGETASYLTDFAKQRSINYSGFYTRFATGDTAQELASSSLGTFKAEKVGATWGTTAVVASATEELITEASAQYVYQNAARVFFLKDDGTLAADDLSTLKSLASSKDITGIVLVGDTSCVSSSVANSIASGTGLTPTRILEGSTAATASLSLAKSLVAAGTNSWKKVVIADATESSNVSVGAVLAAKKGGVLLTCRTSADAKLIEATLEGLIKTDDLGVVNYIDLIGAFDYLDAGAKDTFTAAWSVSYDDLNTTGAISLATGDTFEVNGFVYKVTGSSSARVIAKEGATTGISSPSSVSYNGTNYSITVSTPTWKRVSGDIRYATMQAISKQGFSDGSVSTVVVASGENFPDALAATALAGLYKSPVLLNGKSGLTAEVKSELTRLGAKKVIIIGGTSAIDEAAESELSSLGYSVDRIGGNNREETAQMIYQYGVDTEGISWGSDVVIASSQSFPDALSISSYAYANAAPIILADSSKTVNSDGATAVSKFSRAIIVGGTAMVSSECQSGLKSKTVLRLGGAIRYETSYKVAQFCLREGMSADGAVVATGENFPDALAGGALAGNVGSVVILASDATPTYATDIFSSQKYSMNKAFALGGTSVISESLYTTLANSTKE